MPVYTYTTLDDPLALAIGSTSAQGINASGQIVGFYRNAGAFHCFAYSGGTYTTLDVPSATNGTLANGIDASGQIVGAYTDSTNNQHGFLLSGGIYTTLDDPSPGTTSTTATGIDGAGQIVGQYLDAGGHHGFLLSGAINTTPADRAAPHGTLDDCHD